jgi:hypothetical protein
MRLVVDGPKVVKNLKQMMKELLEPDNLCPRTKKARVTYRLDNSNLVGRKLYIDAL